MRWFYNLSVWIIISQSVAHVLFIYTSIRYFREIYEFISEKLWENIQVWGVLQKFCIADPFSTKNQQMDVELKKLYSPSYNLLFNIIAIPSVRFNRRAAEWVWMHAKYFPALSHHCSQLSHFWQSAIAFIMQSVPPYQHLCTNFCISSMQCCLMYRNFCTNKDFLRCADFQKIQILFRIFIIIYGIKSTVYF